MLRSAIFVTACAFGGVGLYAETSITFELLGDLPGGEFWSYAYGMSADGSVVVGKSSSVSGTEAFRWENGTMKGLGYLSEGSFLSEAYDVSANGSVVVGFSPSYGREAFRWEDGIMTGLGDLPGGEFWSEAYGVSADGSVVVGASDISSSVHFGEAFRWEEGTMSGLGYLSGGGFFSEAYDVSADGSVIVGRSDSSSGLQAFRWEDGTMTRLGASAEVYRSVARGVSYDGTVIVGGFDSASSMEAFRWEDGTMMGLGDLPGGELWSRAHDVSADGSVVVGASFSAKEAVLWSEDNGWQPVSLNDLLESKGVNQNGFVLENATAISSDGTTIIGSGRHSNLDTEAFRVRIFDFDPLIGGTPIDGLQDWFLSDWFGAYNTTLAPWIFHAQHGFIYRDPGSTNQSMFAYDDAMTTWWWTNETDYPFLYAFDPPADNAGTDIESEWLFYFELSSGPRVFGVVSGASTGSVLFFGP